MIPGGTSPKPCRYFPREQWNDIAPATTAAKDWNAFDCFMKPKNEQKREGITFQQLTSFFNYPWLIWELNSLLHYVYRALRETSTKFVSFFLTTKTTTAMFKMFTYFVFTYMLWKFPRLFKYDEAHLPRLSKPEILLTAQTWLNCHQKLPPGICI